ncbi:MAG: DegT/DnrJ/EryC1/StrS family aminotransferase, partial [Opitutaceae bacterium]
MSRTLHFSGSPLGAENIDTVNGVIRGVSVISGGVVARGHDLEVDGVTLAQMHECARLKGQVPVKVDHHKGGGGAAAVCGFLCNFRQEEGKLKADWHLLQTHPQRDQILETAQRMPRGVGLSAAFISPENAERGKARCSELISVDYVTLPAANPDGMFSRRDNPQERLSGVEKVRRVIGAAGRGAEVGAVGGIAARALLRRRGTIDGVATTGAAVGALVNGEPVHLFGHPAAMGPLMAIGKRHGLAVLEDAAQAFGAALDGVPCGARGDAATFSFFPTKNL